MLTARRHTSAGILTGGQEQMVILSAALAPVIVQQIFSFIGSICRERRIIILLCGEVVRSGRVAELTADPALSTAFPSG
ncbi:hypothetical protein CRT60_06250 [Azospirillum palustre]|uniref:ABC transporter ATP-binding protein n=1 Tax=Azospirillum palustre TaxID=2044885 RepID=A0A2B8BNB9_9PROT|nr:MULTISPECIES: hypothetical protein [Azospirillum]MDR6775734.1 ABC-type branched-subunit amino acid transport system ATPase component [Azospirillum sp. BE72]PGH58727.1 hypothetical protein CRT60_06250 [Azospirillum palustre]